MGVVPYFSGNALDFRPKLGDAHFRFLIRFTIARFNFNKMYHFILISRQERKTNLLTKPGIVILNSKRMVLISCPTEDLNKFL